MVSIPILDMHWEVGYGAFFKLAMNSTRVYFVGYSFVDDTDLIQTGASLSSSGQSVIPLMQAGSLHTLEKRSLCHGQQHLALCHSNPSGTCCL